MADRVRVVVGANAATSARQFVTAAGQLGAAARSLAASSATLADQSGWSGATADRFRQDRQRMTALLDRVISAVERMAKGAQSVIDDIDRADASGASALAPLGAAGSTPTGTPAPATTKGQGGIGPYTPAGTLSQLQESPTPQPRPGPPVTPVLQPAAENLSWELQDSMFLPPPYVPPGVSLWGYSPEEKAVLSWMQAHRDTILQEARARNIAPQAIVAAIAWEALKNPQFHLPFIPPMPGDILHQSTGPGKVHIDSAIVNQIEHRGYLPVQDVTDRASMLSTPEGAIKYIAAIMGAYADVEDRVTNHNPAEDIRDNVPVLTNLYQGSDLDRWESYLRRGGRPTYGNPMANWAADPFYQQFLNAALVGPDGSVPATPSPGPRVPPQPVTPQPGPSPTPS